jgi:hypothetical protein
VSPQNFEEVMRTVREIPHEETRRESEDYLEMVMFLDSWYDVLSVFDDYFGAPLKAPGDIPDKMAFRVSDPYGGITEEQALYHLTRDDAKQVAMVWPWSDGKRMTVKILQECR